MTVMYKRITPCYQHRGSIFFSKCVQLTKPCADTSQMSQRWSSYLSVCLIRFLYQIRVNTHTFLTKLESVWTSRLSTAPVTHLRRRPSSCRFEQMWRRWPRQRPRPSDGVWTGSGRTPRPSPAWHPQTLWRCASHTPDHREMIKVMTGDSV